MAAPSFDVPSEFVQFCRERLKLIRDFHYALFAIFNKPILVFSLRSAPDRDGFCSRIEPPPCTMHEFVTFAVGNTGIFQQLLYGLGF